MTQRRHTISGKPDDISVALPIIEAHCKLTDNDFEVVGSRRYPDEDISIVTIESQVSGSDIRNILEAHIDEYDYKSEPTYIRMNDGRMISSLARAIIKQNARPFTYRPKKQI